MNRDLFLRHIEETRDCDEGSLDTAVKKGLYKAKNDRIDPKKMLRLAAACVITFTLCLTLNTEPFKIAAGEYNKQIKETMRGSSQVLAGYIDDLTGRILNLLGGEK